MKSIKVSRRKFLKRTALVTTAAIAAPYVRTSYAAGKLSLGVWDHFVPQVSNVFRKMCQEWGAKNNVDVQVDFITQIGDKDILTASAEALAGTGHDIMTHRSWQIAVHRKKLEPLDDVVAALTKKWGPLNAINEYIAKFDGHWMGMPTVYGSHIKSCLSRSDLYKAHANLDLTRIFPPNDNRDKALVDSWNWDTYLTSAEKLFKAGYPIGLAMGQTSDAIDWLGAFFRSYGSVFIDEKDNIKINSDETRKALEYLKKLLAFNPKETYAWDDASNNRWLISGKGSGVMNPPSAWIVSKRDSPQVATQCWQHDMPRGPNGRFVGSLPFTYGLWAFSQNKTAAKELLIYISEKDQVRQIDDASEGYDLPPFKSYYDFDVWKRAAPPAGVLYNYPLRGDHEANMAGYPARPDVAAQMYAQALPSVMVAKMTQGGESIEGVIKWAQGEMEGYFRK